MSEVVTVIGAGSIGVAIDLHRTAILPRSSATSSPRVAPVW